MTCTKCEKPINDDEREFMVQCALDKCTLHLECARHMIADKNRKIADKQDEIKCECVGEEGQKGSILKGDIKEGLAAARDAKNFQIFAELKAQLQQSTARIASTEAATKDPSKRQPRMMRCTAASSTWHSKKCCRHWQSWQRFLHPRTEFKS